MASSMAWLLPPTHRTTPRAPHGSPRGGRCEIVKALSADAVDRSEVVCLLAFGAAWEADGGGKLVMRRPRNTGEDTPVLGSVSAVRGRADGSFRGGGGEPPSRS